MPPKTQDCVDCGLGIFEEPLNHFSSMHDLLEKHSNRTKTFVSCRSSKTEKRLRCETCFRTSEAIGRYLDNEMLPHSGAL